MEIKNLRIRGADGISPKPAPESPLDGIGDEHSTRQKELLVFQLEKSRQLTKLLVVLRGERVGGKIGDLKCVKFCNDNNLYYL